MLRILSATSRQARRGASQEILDHSRRLTETEIASSHRCYPQHSVSVVQPLSADRGPAILVDTLHQESYIQHVFQTQLAKNLTSGLAHPYCVDSVLGIEQKGKISHSLTTEQDRA